MVDFKKIKLNLLNSKLFEHSINLWLYRKFLICQCLDTDFCPIRIYTPEILSSRGRSMLLIQPTRLTTILQQFWVMFCYVLREMEENAKLHVFFLCRRKAFSRPFFTMDIIPFFGIIYAFVQKAVLRQE